MTSVVAAEDWARGLDELAERIAPLFAGPLFAGPLFGGLRHAIAPQLPGRFTGLARRAAPAKSAARFTNS
jgi:hypothetical protein